MNILHYGIGVPPLRGGGAVEYMINLAQTQKKSGNNVSILFPGELKIFSKSKAEIKKSKKYENIECYELDNPLPMSVFGGFKNPNIFRENRKIKNMEEFFLNLNIDILHIHSLLGLPKELIEFCKKLNISIFFTSHDYYGLGPNPHMFYNNLDISKDKDIKTWLEASKYSSSRLKIYLFHKKNYTKIRKISKKINLQRSKNLSQLNKTKPLEYTMKQIEEMKKLKNYYFEIFDLIDRFHFNSSVSEEVYKYHLGKNIKYKTINITNLKKINKLQNKVINQKIKLGYIGPYFEHYKGFFLFEKLCLESSLKEKYEFILYGDDKFVENPNIKNYGRYLHKSIDKVFQNIDILLLSSKCKETFGLIGIEALNNSSLIVVSENVGVKDLLPTEFIYSDYDELIKILNDLYDTSDFNNSYFSKVKPLKTISEHCLDIESLYSEVR